MGWCDEEKTICIRCNKEFWSDYGSLSMAAGEDGVCPHCKLKDGTMLKPLYLVRKSRENKCISRLSDVFE